MSVGTEIRNHTIVGGLTTLTDKPAVAPLGASGQWQMLQPAGPPLATPEAQTNGVSASNDLCIGALRNPRFASPTGSGGLCPAYLPPGLPKESPRDSSTGGSRPQPSRPAAGHHVPRAAKDRRPCPSHGPSAVSMAQSTSATPTRTGRLVVGTPKALACLPLRAGEGVRPFSSVRPAGPLAVADRRDAVCRAIARGAN